MDSVTVEGILERVKFADDEDAWSVVTVTLETSGREITAVGNLAGVQPGEHVRLTGRWKRHPRWGEQLEVSSCLPVTPATLLGIERYLGSGLVKGIGREIAGRLVARFGLSTLEVIDSHPERLVEVEGIGPVRSRQMQEAWQRQRQIRDVMIFLQSNGLSPSLAVRIWRRFGARSRAVLQENPYRLAEEVWGIGFRTADGIARKLGIGEADPARLQAAAVHLLGEAAQAGDIYVPRLKLAEDCAELTGASSPACVDAVSALVSRGGAVLEREDLVGLPLLVLAESEAARLLRRLLEAPAPAQVAEAASAMSGFERENGITLSSRQREAIEAACRHKALVITGGPGTGKTTLLRAIVAAFTDQGLRVALCAPTGRAAKRLAEATGREAKTIHRLLEFSPGGRRSGAGGEGDGAERAPGFQRNAARPLDCDVLIADEASMIDLPLFRDLMAAVPTGSRLVLVGDQDQLPSVGPGSVLRDLIASDMLPVTVLDEVFRQAEASAIVRAAHAVNSGRIPAFLADEESDLYFLDRDEPEQALETVLELASRRIPRRFGLEPRRDLQVITPMQRGTLGVGNLNKRLQQLLTPDGPAVARGGIEFRSGDRVMQMRNDYERGVFNGDVGVVERVTGDARELAVRFDDRVLDYDWTALDDLALAWACSIHKAQGSEYPAVIIVVHTQHYVLLQRNLIYTAITRARKLAVVVGSRRALAMAVRSAPAGGRATLLAQRLHAGP